MKSHLTKMCSPYPRCPNQSEYSDEFSGSLWAEMLKRWEFGGNPDIVIHSVMNPRETKKSSISGTN